MKTLYLTLSKEPFEVMITGEKDYEFRKDSKWMHSRLFNKDGSKKEYDVVKFVNGYGKERPFFIVEYKGFTYANHNFPQFYSNLLIVNVEKGDFIIKLGKII